MTPFTVYAAWLAKGAATFNHAPFGYLEVSASWDAMIAAAETLNAR